MMSICTQSLFIGCLRFVVLYALQAKPKTVTFERFLQSLFDSCFEMASLDLQTQDLVRIVNELREGNHVDGESDIGVLERAWPGLSTACALFGLFCLFEAQPHDPKIRIRVSEVYFHVLKGAWSYIYTYIPEEYSPII